MGRLARILVLALLATVASAQSKAYMRDAAFTYASDPGWNYSMNYLGGVYMRGTGSAPNAVGYWHYNFSSFAPTPSRFCATGTPVIFINDSGNYGAIPNVPFSFDSPTVSWGYTSITWNNQPNLSQNLGGIISQYPTYTSNYWYRFNLNVNIINTAVRFSNTYTTIRSRYTASTKFSSWETTRRYSGTYKSYISFYYSTCHTQATCNQSTGTCTCNLGYGGSGVDCQVTSCSAATLNGNANFPFTYDGVTATGSCHSTWTGSPKAKCTNKVWGAVTSPCTKITCAADSSGSYGAATFPKTNAGTTATGTCLSGYSKLNNVSPTRSCGNTGAWSSSVSNACVRNKCTAVTKGTASFAITNSLTTATGTCASGYEGSPKCYCEASGTWSNTVTTPCTQRQCAGFTDTSNHVSFTTHNSFATATGTCAAGYSGAPTRLCQASGTWAAMQGTCVQLTCSGGSYNNAQWPTTAAGSSATGTCASGYSGTPSRSCLITGAWSSTVSPACIRNVCGAETYDNADWPANTLSNTVATGTCKAGYEGSPSRSCNANGSWSTTVTNSCSQIFCSATVLDNANWPVIAAGSNAVEGTCQDGYSGPTSRNCDLNGNWTPVSVACTRNTCVGETAGNAVWPSTNSLVTASGTCSPGWAGNPTRPCDKDGAFGEIINPCSQIMCAPRTEAHGTWGSTAAGTLAIVGECDPGWTGAPTRACSIVGVWEDIVGACTQVFCDAKNDSSAQALWTSVAAGSMSIEGDCYPNTSGRPARDCFFNGTWSDVRNPCSTNPCDSLINDEHANWDSPAVVNTIVEGTCVAGYSTATKPSRLCRSDGVWSTEITNPCVPLYCTFDSPSYAAFGASWPESVQAGYSATGTCLPGYTGTSVRSCSLQAEWSTPSPLCQAILCSAISDDGNHQSWPSATAGNTVTGSCLTGYEGSPKRECSIEGQWLDVEDACTQKSCPATTDSTSEWPSTLGGTTVSGACKTGFTGTVSRSCSVDGLWGVVTGSCASVSCVAETNDNVIWQTTSAGSLAVGACETGYGATGALPTRQCQSNGVWDTPSGSCVRLQCAAVEFSNAAWPKVDSMTTNVFGTCVAGWQGAPTRDCDENGLYSSTVNNPCLRSSCPPVNEDGAGSWESAFAGTSDVVGECPAGTAGSPSRECKIDGTWGAIQGECVALQCAAEDFDNAAWPTTTAGQSAFGTCDDGFSGSPARLCSLSGAWEAVNAPCARHICAAVDDGDAHWPDAFSFTTGVEGVCHTGFFGAPKRDCDEDGNWLPITDGCEPLFCVANVHGNAQWESTRASQTAVGECREGYVGTPTRDCLATGVWNETIVNGCEILYPNCESATVDSTFFPMTEPGFESIGICPTGYQLAEAGPPTRSCYANGTWEESFRNPCELIPVESNGNVANLTWVSKTSTSVTIVWDAFNLSAVSSFRVEVAVGTGDFVVANGGAGLNITQQNYTVTGLFQNTLYQLRVTAGDDKGYNDEAAAVIAVTTYIAPAGGLSLSSTTTESLSFSWTASALAQFYDIYYRVFESRRAVTDGFTLYGRIDASLGTATVEGLDAGVAYEVLVLAGRDNATEMVGARIVMTTASSVDEIVTDPGLGLSGSIIAGATVGGVVLLVVILIIVVVSIRRRRAKMGERLDQFGGQEALSTLKEYRSTLSRSRGSMKHAESTTHLSYADKTVVNTVMEVSLPGFLAIDYSTSIQPGPLLKESGSKASYAATLLDNHVAARIGSSSVMVSDYMDAPDMSATDNDERFHREVSLMWSLSFHPNIVSLVAYTEEPRTIITRLYENSLEQFLHEGDDREASLDSLLLIHLSAGIASGLNAVHSMQIAHRSLRSDNIYLQAPGSGETYPTAVIGGFTEARSVEDALPSSNLAEQFPYAAPEVFTRAGDAPVALEEDIAGDAYALAVVLWEMYCRKKPWEGVGQEGVAKALEGGDALPLPESPEDSDGARIAVLSVIQAALSADAARRPGAALMSNKLAGLLGQ